jgi:hypothetical protein
MLAGCGVVRRYRIKGEDRNTAVKAAYMSPNGHGTKVQYRITADLLFVRGSLNQTERKLITNMTAQEARRSPAEQRNSTLRRTTPQNVKPMPTREHKAQ